jgi:SNF2 family DNA or RNA helicase
MKSGTFHVVVTTYEALLICENELTKKREFRYVIFDEAHKLKNSESRIGQISRALKTDRRLLLTGTPLQNDIKELWCLLNLLMPEMFDSKDDF